DVLPQVLVRPVVDPVDGPGRGGRRRILQRIRPDAERGPRVDETGAGDLAVDLARAFGLLEVGPDGEDLPAAGDQDGVLELVAGATDQPLHLDEESRPGVVGPCRERQESGAQTDVDPTRDAAHACLLGGVYSGAGRSGAWGTARIPPGNLVGREP